MRNDDNDCKCILSSYNNVLTGLTQTYIFLTIPRAKASHNIWYFSYIFVDYINHKNLSENILLRKDKIFKTVNNWSNTDCKKIS